jgi:hypothetical protein
MKIRVGGKLSLIYQSKTINADKREAAKIGLKVYIDRFSGILNLDSEEADLSQYCKNYSDCHLYTKSGGNSSTPNFGDLTEWINSITTEKCVLVDYWGDDALIPIYELIDDPVRKAEIKAYVDNYIDERKAVLAEE